MVSLPTCTFSGRLLQYLDGAGRRSLVDGFTERAHERLRAPLDELGDPVAVFAALSADDILSIGDAELGHDVDVDVDRLKVVVEEPLRTDEGRDVYPGLHLKAAALLLAMMREGPVRARQRAHGAPVDGGVLEPER